MPHPTTDAQLRSALDAAARGWRVFPLKPGDKPPAIAQWQTKASTDPRRIERCWTHAPYNIGIATGVSRLVVIDLDVPKTPDDVPWPPWALPGVRSGADVFALLCERHSQPYPAGTYTVRTRAGGIHLYFTAPDGIELRNTQERHGWKVDTRAVGGYVVAAGSIVGGRHYTVLHDAPAAPLPPWLAGLLSPNPPAGSAAAFNAPVVHDLSAYAAAALRNEATNVSTALQGRRNATLTRAARSLGRLIASGDLAYDVVTEALKEAGEAAGLPSRDCAATISSAINWAVNHARRDA